MFDLTEAAAATPKLDTAGLVPRLGTIAAELAGLDVTSLPDRDLGPSVLALLEAQRRLDAALLHLVGELDARELCEAETGLRTSTWITARALTAPGTARRLVRDAKDLRAMPNVDAALTEGRIGRDHVRVLTRAGNPRVRPGIDALVDHLCDDLASWRFDAWAANVAGYAEELDQDGGHDPAGDVPQDQVTVGRTGDALTGRFVLHGEAAAVVEQALDQLMAEQFRTATADAEATPDLPVPAGPALRALGFTEMARRALACDADTSRPAPPDVSVVVEVPADGDLRRAVATTPAGQRLPAHVAHTLCCDGALTAVLVDADGLPLFVGRSVRLATAAQRRALAARDGGCAFPHCDAPPSWCDAHHVRWWNRDGGTDLDNLTLLCRHHHGVIHRRDWTATLDSDQRLRITTPSGRILHGQRRGHTPHAPP